jgi:hypothetical protein
MYAALGTRPDIAFATNFLAQFSANPSRAHYTAVLRVFKYLAGTLDWGIRFSKSGQALITHGFSDSDFVNNETDSKSISGFIFFLSEGPVSWSARKQPVVAHSTMEAEYIALAAAGRDAAWIRAFLRELGFPQKEPTLIQADNNAAIALTRGENYHSRAKHIRVPFHEIRDSVANGDVEIRYVRSESNSADIFTKALRRPDHVRLRQQIGMVDESRGSVVNSN